MRHSWPRASRQQRPDRCVREGTPVGDNRVIHYTCLRRLAGERLGDHSFGRASRAAQNAQDAADIAAADDFKDPWGEKTPKQVTADETREATKDAEAQRNEAVQAAEERAAAQQRAAQEQAAAQQRATDPEGFAAKDAAKAADVAEQRAREVFMEIDEGYLSDHTGPSGAERRYAADQAAILARQQADAARAAADAAKAARATSAAQSSSTGWKPDKP